MTLGLPLDLHDPCANRLCLYLANARERSL
jgi:hypothetical protein